MTLRDLVSGQERHNLEFHMVLRFPALAITPDGHLGLGGGDDGKVRVWDLVGGTRLREMAAHRLIVRENVTIEQGTLD